MTNNLLIILIMLLTSMNYNYIDAMQQNTKEIRNGNKYTKQNTPKIKIENILKKTKKEEKKTNKFTPKNMTKTDVLNASTKIKEEKKANNFTLQNTTKTKTGNILKKPDEIKNNSAKLTDIKNNMEKKHNLKKEAEKITKNELPKTKDLEVITLDNSEDNLSKEEDDVDIEESTEDDDKEYVFEQDKNELENIKNTYRDVLADYSSVMIKALVKVFIILMIWEKFLGLASVASIEKRIISICCSALNILNYKCRL